MQISTKKGFSFGLTSSVITTLGLIIGLYSFTGSRLFVIGGILTIAVADSLSDALGIHISEESTKKKTKDIWTSTISTFFTKFIFSLTFIIPFLIFSIFLALITSIFWGLLILIILSYFIAKDRNEKELDSFLYS
jgi:VIT1/CCC1 family predicted Fe2+/Mn2+ transporter